MDAAPSPPAPVIPTRHRESRQARHLLGLVQWLLPPEARPSTQRWQAIGEALAHGDAPMDRLVDWMLDAGMKPARAQFELAVERGVGAVVDAPVPLRDFFAGVEPRPAWVDEQLLRVGADVFGRGGIDGVYAGRDVALVGGYQAAAFNRTLLLTGALQKGPTRRFAETLRWALDCTAPGGMDRFAAGFKSTLRVRLIHALVRRHVRRLADWRMNDWGLPINQVDMAATLLGALYVPVVCAQLMGVPHTRRERDAAVHVVRYAGWLMGVEERWLPHDDRSAQALLAQLLLSIAHPDETSPMLARPMVDEPLQRPYPRLKWLRGRFDRARHLSISRTFLGARGMRSLGLPVFVLPWYPLVKAPINLTRLLLARLLPGGLARAADRGRRAQEAFLTLLSGSRPAVVGEAAQHVSIQGG